MILSSSKAPGIVNVAVHFGVDPSGISGPCAPDVPGVPDVPGAPGVPGVPSVPGMPSGILSTSEVDMELAGASISIEVEDLQGANLTLPSRDTSTFLLDGIYIRTSDLPMYPVR